MHWGHGVKSPHPQSYIICRASPTFLASEWELWYNGVCKLRNLEYGQVANLRGGKQ